MKKINTLPNIYIDNDTYLAVSYNWGDLNEKVEYVIDNFNELNQRINENIRNVFKKEYSYENLCLYYYNMFNNLSDVEKK